MNYKIAIRTCGRYDTIKNKTIKFLEENLIPSDKIFIFCPENEIEMYKNKLGDIYTYCIGSSEGVSIVDNLIRSYFDFNDYIIQLDDDIHGLYKKDEKSEIITYDLYNLITNGYNLMIDNDLHLWGIYPIKNYYFMKNNISYDLKFCIGCIYGYFNTKDIILVDNLRTDFETTILYFKRDNGVIRFNNYCVKANLYTGKGGTCDLRTIEKMTTSANYMVTTYPEYCDYKKSKSKYTEIRLKKKPFISLKNHNSSLLVKNKI